MLNGETGHVHMSVYAQYNEMVRVDCFLFNITYKIYFCLTEFNFLYFSINK